MPRPRHSAIRSRIVDVAARLAEQGGFENVRQRDVAARAGVALGTLYKSFQSKEELLSAALERETAVLERRFGSKPFRGGSPAARVAALFRAITRALCSRPNYARALLRGVASGEPEVAASITAHQKDVTRMVVAAIRGAPLEAPATRDEEIVAELLQLIWFGAMVGWSAELHGERRVVEQLDHAARLLLR